MLDDRARAVYKKNKKGFVYPNYRGYSLFNVPNTAMKLLGVETDHALNPALYQNLLKRGKVRRVLVIFIDGFGYMQWKRYYKRFEFLKKFTERGRVTPITTVFPSTTAAAVTSTNVGLPPIKHQLPEWYVYIKKLDSTIATLPFKRIDNAVPDSLRKEGFTANELFRGESIYSRLGKRGVKSCVFLPKAIAKSVYSSKVYTGASIMPYHHITDLFVSLRKSLRNKKGRELLHVYIPDLDSMEHTFGPYTEEYESQLSVIMHLLETELLEVLGKEDAKDTLVIITADHGQVNVDPQDIIYLNKYKKVVEAFELSGHGKRILPVGSPRDLFLHIKPERLDETCEYLKEKLGEYADIVNMRDLVNNGVFGDGKASAEFYSRIGNLAILPYGNNTVGWDYSPLFEFKFYGHHGGLTEEEMLIPFAAAWLSDLIK